MDVHGLYQPTFTSRVGVHHGAPCPRAHAGPGLPGGSGAVGRADGGADGHAEPPRDALAHRPGRRVPRRGVDRQPLPWPGKRR